MNENRHSQLLFRTIFVTLLVLTLSFSLPTSSLKAEDQSSGCGLGWAVTKRNSLLSSLVRAYTNVTFSSTFGMTSGTSGCAQHSIVMNDKKSLHYTEANYHELMVEMSQGQGEFLQNYAQVLGCSSNSYPSFAKRMQQHYHQIFSKSDSTPREILNNVQLQIQSDQGLDQNCHSKVI